MIGSPCLCNAARAAPQSLLDLLPFSRTAEVSKTKASPSTGSLRARCCGVGAGLQRPPPDLGLVVPYHLVISLLLLDKLKAYIFLNPEILVVFSERVGLNHLACRY